MEYQEKQFRKNEVSPTPAFVNYIQTHQKIFVILIHTLIVKASVIFFHTVGIFLGDQTQWMLMSWSDHPKMSHLPVPRLGKERKDLHCVWGYVMNVGLLPKILSMYLSASARTHHTTNSLTGSCFVLFCFTKTPAIFLCIWSSCFKIERCHVVTTHCMPKTSSSRAWRDLVRPGDTHKHCIYLNKNEKNNL